MARWTTLTIVPDSDDAEATLNRALAGAGTPTACEVRHRKETGEPYLGFKHRGRRMYRSADIADSVADVVQVASVAVVNNTTDSVSMAVYASENGSLRRMETQPGRLVHRRHDSDDPATHYQTVVPDGGSIGGYGTLLDYFEAEYGVRPLFNFFDSDEHSWA